VIEFNGTPEEAARAYPGALIEASTPPRVWLPGEALPPHCVATEPGPVPQFVTRKQARKALIHAGFFDAVQPAIDAIEDPIERALMQTEWDDSEIYERHDPALLALAEILDLDSDQVDALFIQAKEM
jgi:hypothetical protein